MSYSSQSAFADGVLPVPFYKEVGSIWDFVVGFYSKIFALVFPVTVVIEYLVFYALLGRPAKARRKLFLYILFVNTITNPAAQLCMLFIADDVLLGSKNMEYLADCIIEVLVVIVEFGLMTWLFGRMHRHGDLDEPVSAIRTLVITLLANLASFTVVYEGFSAITAVLSK